MVRFIRNRDFKNKGILRFFYEPHNIMQSFVSMTDSLFNDVIKHIPNNCLPLSIGKKDMNVTILFT